MSVQTMTIENFNYWQKRMQELKNDGFTNQKWRDLGNELRQKHNLTEQQAIAVLHGDIKRALTIE